MRPNTAARMSSIVTIPALLPYSSSTMAKLSFSSLKRLRASRAVRVSGRTTAFFMQIFTKSRLSVISLWAKRTDL